MTVIVIVPVENVLELCEIKRKAKIYLAKKYTAEKALDKFLNSKLKEHIKPTLKRSIEGH